MQKWAMSSEHKRDRIANLTCGPWLNAFLAVFLVQVPSLKSLRLSVRIGEDIRDIIHQNKTLDVLSRGMRFIVSRRDRGLDGGFVPGLEKLTISHGLDGWD